MNIKMIIESREDNAETFTSLLEGASPREAKRLQLFASLATGATLDEACEEHEVGSSTASSWLVEYIQHGVQGLLNSSNGGNSRRADTLDDETMTAFRNWVEDNRPTLEEAYNHHSGLREEAGLDPYSVSYFRAGLERHHDLKFTMQSVLFVAEADTEGVAEDESADTEEVTEEVVDAAAE